MLKRLFASIALIAATALGVTCTSAKPSTAVSPNANVSSIETAAPANPMTTDAGALSHDTDEPLGTQEVSSGNNSSIPQPPANDPPPAPAMVYAPAAPSGRYELRSVRTGFRSWQPTWVWVANQPQPVGRTTFGGCAGGRCGR